MAIAVIAARSGSKRIKNKNIKIFCGKPIIYYSIKAAKDSKLFKEIIVTTDSNKISRVAHHFGAKIFLRSKKLSTDNVMLLPVIYDVLKKSKSEYACYIYATAPLIKFRDIQNSYRKIKKYKADCCLAVTNYDFPVSRSLVKDNIYIKFKYPKWKNIPSQKTPKIFHDAGLFFWLNIKNFIKSKNLLPKKTIEYYINSNDAQDIDTISDWNLATYKFKKRNYK